jgi:hypothetical protein
MTDIIRVNNNEFSYRSCEFKLDLEPYEGLSSIDFGDKRVPAKVKGMNRSGAPIARTRGDYDLDPLNITFLESTWVQIAAKLTLKGLGSMGNAEVQGTLSVYELGLIPLLYVFKDMKLTDFKSAKKEGNEPNMVETAWDIMQLTQNGQVLYSRGLL